MTSPSSYADVFKPLHLKSRWPQLEQSGPLSVLHTKFWGIPIQDDEPAPRTPSEGQPMSIDEDEKESEDERESEVGPGCFILNLDIEDSPIPRLWVRKDYIRLYDFCNGHYEMARESLEKTPTLAPAIVITGQPGIGKPFFSSSRPSFQIAFYKKGKATGFIMPSADASVKANHSCGIFHHSGICLSPMAYSNAPELSIKNLSSHIFGRLSMRTNLPTANYLL